MSGDGLPNTPGGHGDGVKTDHSQDVNAAGLWRTAQPYVIRAASIFLMAFFAGLQGGLSPGKAAGTAAIGAGGQLFPSVKQ